jgi:DNA (cytosine-5)-methyltransferase 1
MRILNLYAGIGGNRHHWDGNVTAVELQPDIAQAYGERFPDDLVVVGDAHQFLLEHYEEFDFIWSSPPCPSHSRMWGQNRTPEYPDMKLYQEILFLQRWAPRAWVVENVKPWYRPLVEPSGSSGRHLFWSNLELFWLPEPPPQPPEFMGKVTPEALGEYLGIEPSLICCGKSHEPKQVMRNCVHPQIGRDIMDRANQISTSTK